MCSLEIKSAFPYVLVLQFVNDNWYEIDGFAIILEMCAWVISGCICRATMKFFFFYWWASTCSRCFCKRWGINISQTLTQIRLHLFTVITTEEWNALWYDAIISNPHEHIIYRFGQQDSTMNWIYKTPVKNEYVRKLLNPSVKLSMYIVKSTPSFIFQLEKCCFKLWKKYMHRASIFITMI